MSKERIFGSEPLPFEVEHNQEIQESLSPLADYVLYEMPEHLAAVRTVDESERSDKYAELAEFHETKLEEVRPLIEANLDPAVAKVTQMDLLFMFGCYIPKGPDMYQIAPPSLMPLIRQQADKFPGLETFMSYEMIIDVNSSEARKSHKLRTFFDGAVGEMEQHFYYGHHEAEPLATDAAYMLKGLIDNPELYDANEVFSVANEKVAEFTGYMGRYGRLDPDAFNQFRVYLQEYADGTRNASGAFMPSVQLLELTLHTPTPEQVEYLDESMQYFPAWAQPKIQEWKESSKNGKNILDMLDRGEITLEENAEQKLLVLIKQFAAFRNAHYNITKKHIPKAFHEADKLSASQRREVLVEKPIMKFDSPDQVGTGGYNIPNLLTNGIARLNRTAKHVASIVLGE